MATTRTCTERVEVGGASGSCEGDVGEAGCCAGRREGRRSAKVRRDLRMAVAFCSYTPSGRVAAWVDGG
jgi:hypothetical protein